MKAIVRHPDTHRRSIRLCFSKSGTLKTLSVINAYLLKFYHFKKSCLAHAQSLALMTFEGCAIALRASSAVLKA